MAAVWGQYVFISGAGSGGGVYVDALNETITNITGMPIFSNGMVVYNEFIVGATTPGTIPLADNILHFSDRPAAVGGIPGLSWANDATGLSQVAIGDGAAIAGLFAQKNTLAIAKVGGEWYTMTGAYDNGTVRKADLGLDFLGVGQPVKQSTIWYPNGKDLAGFTGAQTVIEPLPDFLPFQATSQYSQAPFKTMAPLVNTDEFILFGIAQATPILGNIPTHFIGNSVAFDSPAQLEAFIRHGVYGPGTSVGWTRHTLTPSLNSSSPNGLSRSANFRAIFVGNGLVWLIVNDKTDFNNTTNFVNVYQFNIRQEIPYESLSLGLTGVDKVATGQSRTVIFPSQDPSQQYQDTDSGTAVSASISTPEWWSPDGFTAKVMGVIIDLDYDAAVYQNLVNLGKDPSTFVGMNVDVEALNIRRTDASIHSKIQPWAPPPGTRSVPSSNASMLRHRAVFRFGDEPPASGFRVNLTSVRGIQVYRIIAVVDTEVANETF